ncbi:MAG TPA: YdeI/OmpD-associated family protein [Saprospiraceae bacterium]|nr:YdeI/OmpD-associated family protein [Saprospiraceae bacterium]
MKPTFFPTPAHFRKWLEKNHKKKDELWVGFYKTSSGIPSITWPQLVDELLCFGWIDGIRKSIDDTTYMNRVTPRRATGIWSNKNIKRFAELKAAGLIMPAGQTAFDAKKGTYTNRYSFEQATITLLPAYEKKLKANKKAWAFFQSLPPSKQKPTIWWVMSAKQKETQLRRLAILIASSEKGEKIPPLIVTKKS